MRERDTTRWSQSCAFLNVRRMSVTQGYFAGPAASCGSDIRTLTSARHVGVAWRHPGRVGVCCLVLYFITDFCCLCLYFVQVEMENVSKVWKIYWILFHCPSNIFLWKGSSILLFFSFKMSVAHHLSLLQVLRQPWVSPCSLFNNHAMTSYIPFWKPLSVCHAGVISCCNVSRSRKRHCVVVKNQAFSLPRLGVASRFLNFLL